MNRCQTITLAQYAKCMIEYCQDCQVMHLHLDSITVKIGRDSMAALGEVIHEALDNLQRLEHDTSAVLAHFSRRADRH